MIVPKNVFCGATWPLRTGMFVQVFGFLCTMTSPRISYSAPAQSTQPATLCDKSSSSGARKSLPISTTSRDTLFLLESDSSPSFFLFLSFFLSLLSFSIFFFPGAARTLLSGAGRGGVSRRRWRVGKDYKGNRSLAPNIANFPKQMAVTRQFPTL